MKFFARVPKFNFMAQRKVGLVVSSVLTAAAIFLVAFHGLNFGIDFTGGVLVEVSYPESVKLERVRSDLDEAGYERAVVQYFGPSVSSEERSVGAECGSTCRARWSP